MISEPSVSSEIGYKSMPKVGGVATILISKVQKRDFQTLPRGFRGGPSHFTCEKVTAIPTLLLKVAESATPQNTRHFCQN